MVGLADVLTRLRVKQFNEVIHDTLIKIFPSKMCVTGSCSDLENSVINCENLKKKVHIRNHILSCIDEDNLQRHRKCHPQDRTRAHSSLHPSCSIRMRSRLLAHWWCASRSALRWPRHPLLPGVGHHSVCYLLTQISFCCILHFPKDHCRNFFGRKNLKPVSVLILMFGFDFLSMTKIKRIWFWCLPEQLSLPMTGQSGVWCRTRCSRDLPWVGSWQHHRWNVLPWLWRRHTMA